MSLTIGQALRQAGRQLTAHSHSPRLDGELLLAHCLGVNRSHLHAWPEKTLDAAQQHCLEHLLARRRRGEPLAYLLGEQEFWSLKLRVTPDVLVPRPETEILVETALELLDKGSPRNVADLGTGSGAIALALASERPELNIFASDRSAAALAVARDNRRRLKLDNMRLLLGHWLCPFGPRSLELIAANPPYVAADDPELEASVLRHEPRQALIADGNGLAELLAIAHQARDTLRAGGWLVLEHGARQGQAMRQLLTTLGYRDCTSRRDLAGLERVSLARWPG